jgi:hypothetical protein
VGAGATLWSPCDSVREAGALQCVGECVREGGAVSVGFGRSGVKCRLRRGCSGTRVGLGDAVRRGVWPADWHEVRARRLD